MADPISVAASIVGLLTAGAQVSSVISNFGSSIISASETAQNVLSEIRDITIVLRSLQRLLQTIENDGLRRGSEHVNAEDFALLLMSTMCTFSELQKLIITALGVSSADGHRMGAQKKMGVRRRYRWVRKEAQVQKVLARLMRQHGLLSQLISIISCTSQIEAGRQARMFDLLIREEARNMDTAMCKRMQLLNHVNGCSLNGLPINTSTMATSAIHTKSIITDTVTASLSASASENELDTPNITNDTSFQKSIHCQQFSDDITASLHSSSVYRRSRGRKSMDTVRSIPTIGTDLQDGMSTFSKLSNLSVISSIAVFKLPISATELFNGSLYANNKAAGSSTEWTEQIVAGQGLRPQVLKRPMAKFAKPVAPDLRQGQRISAKPNLHLPHDDEIDFSHKDLFICDLESLGNSEQREQDKFWKTWQWAPHAERWLDPLESGDEEDV
ncbi:hypothetical protein BJ508DRAFT_358719 [Ascobolus immersus RN42]|uniref:Fungal N-terminal domain-containing protein n=1 Tax=Ascobolus immersus RN42 TaxID=1160509 RepID=A0A3N4IIW4_ASCIM|nr:hypothetical protein BJ508DRAFT_358719 [Ascobolus immersus RN42]